MNTNRMLIVIVSLLAGILVVVTAGAVMLWRYSRPSDNHQSSVTADDITLGQAVDGIASAPPAGFTLEGMKSKAAKAQLSALATQLEIFQLDVGRYPTNTEGLASLRTAPANAAGWSGPYASKDIPADPWEDHYRYEQLGSGFRVWSLGPDGLCGTEDDIEHRQ